MEGEDIIMDLENHPNKDLMRKSNVNMEMEVDETSKIQSNGILSQVQKLPNTPVGVGFISRK